MARQERERRYLTDYLLRAFPGGNYACNVELGPIPQEYVQRHGVSRAAALFRPTRPRVDAVAWSPDVYLLIEAKVRDIRAGIADLMYYRGIMSVTPDAPYFDGQPVAARLVIPWTVDWVTPVATANGVQVVVDWQEWVAEYVRERQHYFTPEWRSARAEKKRLRELLGVD